MQPPNCSTPQEGDRSARAPAKKPVKRLDNSLPSVQHPPQITPLAYTAPQAAKALAISPRTLWGLTDPRGPIPCIHFGRAVRYDPDDLREFVQKQKGGCRD